MATTQILKQPVELYHILLADFEEKDGEVFERLTRALEKIRGLQKEQLKEFYEREIEINGREIKQEISKKTEEKSERLNKTINDKKTRVGILRDEIEKLNTAKKGLDEQYNEIKEKTKAEKSKTVKRGIELAPIHVFNYISKVYGKDATSVKELANSVQTAFNSTEDTSTQILIKELGQAKGNVPVQEGFYVAAESFISTISQI